MLTMKALLYHSCSWTEGKSPSFSASPTEPQWQKAKGLHYPSQGNPPPPPLSTRRQFVVLHMILMRSPSSSFLPQRTKPMKRPHPHSYILSSSLVKPHRFNSVCTSVQGGKLLRSPSWRTHSSGTKGSEFASKKGREISTIHGFGAFS